MIPHGSARATTGAPQQWSPASSTLSATTPTPFETVSGPSKAFGFSFAESQRRNHSISELIVIALLPGVTDSDFHANAGMGSTTIGSGPKDDKTEVARRGCESVDDRRRPRRRR